MVSAPMRLPKQRPPRDDRWQEEGPSAEPAPTKETLVSVEDLSVDFRGGGGNIVHAVRNVSFDIGKAETVALVGEFRLGKTVTALSILRLLPYPAASHPSGVIRFKGENLMALPLDGLRHVRGNQISMIFQEPMTSLNPLHTIEQQIGEVLKIHRGLSNSAAQERVLDLLNKVGIEEPKGRLNSYPHQLSGGQRQRVMIAMALANEPDLLIADEPTTALDVTIQAQILDLLLKLKSEFNMAMLLITHDLGIVRKMADRVCVMTNGEIVERGVTRDIFASPQHPYTKHLLASEPKGTPPAADPKAPTILEAKDLRVWFPIKRGFMRHTVGHIKAVDGIDLEVKEGQTLGVVGESAQARRRSDWPCSGSCRATARSSISATASKATTQRRCGRSAATCRSCSRILTARSRRACRSRRSSRRACSSRSRTWIAPSGARGCRRR